MNNSYRVDNIKKLQTLTKAYHANSKPYKELVKKVFCDGDPTKISKEDESKMDEYVKQSVSLQQQIMDLMENTLFIVPVSGSGYVLRQHGELDRYAYLKPVDGMGLIKFQLETVRELSKATMFTDKEEAEIQLNAANYALFRSYIEGIGAEKK